MHLYMSSSEVQYSKHLSGDVGEEGQLGSGDAIVAKFELILNLVGESGRFLLFLVLFGLLSSRVSCMFSSSGCV